MSRRSAMCATATEWSLDDTNRFSRITRNKVFVFESPRGILCRAEKCGINRRVTEKCGIYCRIYCSNLFRYLGFILFNMRRAWQRKGKREKMFFSIFSTYQESTKKDYITKRTILFWIFDISFWFYYKIIMEIKMGDCNNRFFISLFDDWFL